MSGDANESSSGDGNGDEDENEDGNEDTIGEGGEDAKKRKKPHNICRRDHALLFRTRHYLCIQGVAIEGNRHLRWQGPVPVHAHRTEGVTGSKGRKGANGVGAGSESGAGTEMGTGSGRGWERERER